MGIKRWNNPESLTNRLYDRLNDKKVYTWELERRIKEALKLLNVALNDESDEWIVKAIEMLENGTGGV